jgi:hypothetical protein
MYTALIKVAVSVVWEGVTTLFARGTILRVVAGSALETAIGTANITNVTTQGEWVQGVLATSN